MASETDPFITDADLTVTPENQADWATARIREYCRWHIFPQVSSTVKLNVDGGRLLLLPTLKLVEITSITLADGTAVDTGSVTTSESGLVARRDCAWPCGLSAVTVNFVHGWDTLPDALKEVAVSIAKRMPAAMAQVQQAQAGGVLMTYGAPLGGGFTGAGLTYPEQMVLDKYRIGNQP